MSQTENALPSLKRFKIVINEYPGRKTQVIIDRYFRSKDEVERVFKNVISIEEVAECRD